MEYQQRAGYITGSPAPTADERTWGMIAHLSGLATSFIYMPFLGPLLVMLIKGKESAWVEQQAKEALNFQILITALVWGGSFLTATLVLACIGIPVAVLGGLFGLVLSIIAGIKANNGETYRYPATPRLVK
ncbi:MAG TPA: DUF4870 domain-containing protein [Archangium sp.]|jgi:hypothetical protein|uniref:DUF4870 domain-containing protein n=1 Tax=Archangium sp. TaxID=1872627 RepID=UPI002ED9B445